LVAVFLGGAAEEVAAETFERLLQLLVACEVQRAEVVDERGEAVQRSLVDAVLRAVDAAEEREAGACDAGLHPGFDQGECLEGFLWDEAFVPELNESVGDVCGIEPEVFGIEFFATAPVADGGCDKDSPAADAIEEGLIGIVGVGGVHVIIGGWFVVGVGLLVWFSGVKGNARTSRDDRAGVGCAAYGGGGLCGTAELDPADDGGGEYQDAEDEWPKSAFFLSPLGVRIAHVTPSIACTLAASRPDALRGALRSRLAC